VSRHRLFAHSLRNRASRAGTVLRNGGAGHARETDQEIDEALVATDPAALIHNYFNTPGTFSLTYTFNPYLGIGG